jgi:multidrug efflux pump subunit AcrB
MVDIDPLKLQARGLTPADVVNAVNAQNLTLPSGLAKIDALIFNRNGMQVAVVDNDKAEIRKVRVTRDLGTRVEVDSGIKAGDQVILNPPVTLADGSRVQPRPDAASDK